MNDILLFPAGNPLDNLFFWSAVSITVLLVVYLWPYVRYILLIIVVGIVVALVGGIKRHNENSQVVSVLNESRQTSRVWAGLNNFTAWMGMDTVDVLVWNGLGVVDVLVRDGAATAAGWVGMGVGADAPAETEKQEATIGSQYFTGYEWVTKALWGPAEG